MAGNIDGYFHDNVLVRGSEMAKITNALAGQRSYVIPGYAQGMDITVSGLNVTVQPGMAVIQGYPVVIKQPMTLSLPANSSGYIVITIDKSQEVTFEGDPNDPGSYTWENNQVALEFVASLINGDLNDEGTIQTFALASVTTTATTSNLNKDNLSYFDVNGGFYTVYKGGNFFKSMHMYTWDEKYFKNKIVLIWSRWNKTTGVPENRHFKTFEIDRHALDEVGQGLGWRIDLEAGETYKYFYLRNNQITGYDDNVGTQTWCLRQIYVY